MMTLYSLLFFYLLHSLYFTTFRPSHRYTLYVSYACPWAHRCLIMLALKGLSDAISVAVVHPVWGVVDAETGRKSWVFGNETIGTVVDGINVTDINYNKASLREIYELHNPAYVGRYTVPLLFDKQTQSIVNNESSEILEIFQSEFDSIAQNPDFTIWPASVSRDAINDANTKMYNSWNNGVYRAGFAQAQGAYEEGVTAVFDHLDYMEELLSTRRFICGDVFTESDIRFLVTALRFDSVYNIHFKCSKARISDYKNVYGYIRDCWQNVFNDKAKKSFSEEHIKQHYYCSHEKLNPFAIIPITTPLDLEAAVDRAGLVTSK